MRPRGWLAAALCAATALGTVAAAGPAALGAEAHPARPAAAYAKPVVVYRNLALLDGDTATVYSDGLAMIVNRRQQSVAYQMVPPAGGVPGTAAALPTRPELAWELTKGQPRPFVPGALEVVLAAPATATAPSQVVPKATLARLRAATARPGGPPAGLVPAYTTNGPLNRVLAGLGAAEMAQVFRGASGTTFGPAAREAGLDLARAYVVHLTNATMPAAVSALRASPAIAYAAPDWTVAPSNTPATPLPAAARRAAAAGAGRLRHAAAAPRQAAAGLAPLPGNFALQSSEQSLLNRPATDWVPAYEALEGRYHQLPGTGETITDVSLGDLVSDGISSSDPCSGFESAFGPTTIISNGQRYLDWPSMPLIPTWTASAKGALDSTGEVCGVDPFDTEIGLDFAMMAPLPDSLQRPGAQGSGLGDLLGMAPGASFRLVVPSDTSGAITSVDAALLAAAQQQPRPNVITASLAFGLDADGFPSRYLEDDPLTERLVYALVHYDHITVSISANDGLRQSTNAPVSPSGGSAATDVVPPRATPTSLDDVELSTTPSEDPDSGAIAAGGVTLDDVAAAPPLDPGSGSLGAQQAFPSLRWDGSQNFSSGFGSRVNLSAPADDVIGVEHTAGGTAGAVTLVNIGGTSASAQEIGAAAAVTQQAARLSGNDRIAGDPLALREYLERTAAPVPGVPQADQALNVGPQVDLGRAVTGLVGPGRPGAGQARVARVAVAQRLPGNGFDTEFVAATDPGAISLAGAGQNAWITIAPDWVGLPGAARYSLTALTAAGASRALATGPWARLQPDAILAGAGLQPSTQAAQTVSLRYTASVGAHVLAEATMPLTFTPVSGHPQALAPLVPAVTTGPDITVRYDLTGQTAFTNPVLVVSAPGRMTPLDFFYKPIYSVPLTATSGTVSVPVSALQGGGVYGIAIQATPTTFQFSDFAFTRVQDAPSAARPAAPLLSAPGSPPGHLLTIPEGGRFTVNWDVTGIPRAADAALEISAAGPTQFGSFAPFNNPDGTVRDDNGRDSGSVYFARLPGRRGSVTLSAAEAGLYPAMYHNVRVLPLAGNGTAAAEASDVSTVTMNGVAAPDGGLAKFGFGVDAHGGDGLLTSSQLDASGNVTESSAYSFSQATNEVTRTLASSPAGADQYATANGGAPGILAGDVGLYADTNNTSFATSYAVLNPLTSGHAPGSWTPPDAPIGAQVQPADNQDTPTTALMIGNFVVGYRVLSTNIAANTFGPSYSLSPVLSSFSIPEVTGFAQDTSTGTAVVGASDFTNSSAPPTVITVDLSNGALHTTTGVGSGFPLGLAVDSAADTALMPTSNSGSVGLYDLATGAVTQPSPGGFSYQHPATAGHGEYLLEEVASPDALLTTPGLGATPNNDSLSSVVVLNQQGQVMQRLERFNDFNYFSASIGDYLQLNPATRTGYTLGPDGQELAPFTYTGSQ